MRPFDVKTHKFSLLIVVLIATCLVFLTGCPPSSKTAKENLAQTESEAERDAAIQKQIDDYDRQMEKLASDRESIVKPYIEKRTKQRDEAILSSFPTCRHIPTAIMPPMSCCAWANFIGSVMPSVPIPCVPKPAS